MSDQPNKNWGLDMTGMFTMEPDHNIVKMPTAISAGTIFYDSTVVTLESETIALPGWTTSGNGWPAIVTAEW